MSTNKNSVSLPLETILQRNDVWRGSSKRFSPQQSLDTGYPALNKALLDKGWPLGCLLEVCQPVVTGYSEWLLLAPALRQLGHTYTVLLNPPAMPFCQALLQLGLDLDRLLVVQAAEKAGFVKSFTELSASRMCGALIAWQPREAFSYTDLRKCLLCVAENKLSLLFRHANTLQEHSPAGLRLCTQLIPQGLRIEILKQKGMLVKTPRVVQLPRQPSLSDGEERALNIVVPKLVGRGRSL